MHRRVLSRVRAAVFDCKKNLHHTPPNNHVYGGDVVLKLRAHLIPVQGPDRTTVGEFLSPSSRAHIGCFGSAAVTKSVSPATRDFIRGTMSRFVVSDSARFTCVDYRFIDLYFHYRAKLLTAPCGASHPPSNDGRNNHTPTSHLRGFGLVA